MKVSVIIVNYNVCYFLEVCLHSVRRATRGMDVEIIVVDNNSTDDSMQMVRNRFPEVICIENKDNKGFSKANNQAVAIAKGEYILFLNPDTVMPEDFFLKTLGYMDTHPDVGCLGPKLIDGKGVYAPDSKKSFPTLSVAIFKTTSINKLFPKSPYFNKYYAVHLSESEISEVDVLCGCCMLLRSKLLDTIGLAFDEDYFMYCEDVDLSYRVQKSGYKNIYFPEARLIHYKGESTRKSTLSYVRIFNEALMTFVKKHYTSRQAKLFIAFINVGIFLRAVMGVLRSVFKVLRMPLFDALILLGTLLTMSELWVQQVKEIKPLGFEYMIVTFPVYIILWVVSLFLNGAYDSPYRALRVVRGMLTGLVFNLAFYGLLSAEFRYSRVLLILTSLVGTVALLGLHEFLYRIGIVKFIPYESSSNKAVIVADENSFIETVKTLSKVPSVPDIAGRISVDQNIDSDALCSTNEMPQVVYASNVNEIIFCIEPIGYSQMFDLMEQCGSHYEYKIHLQGTKSFVGSNSSHTAGDLYTIDKRYNLAAFSMQRNKRVLDICFALLFLVATPIALFRVPSIATYINNCFAVLFGKKTWIGYPATKSHLPKTRDFVLPPYNLQENYDLPQNLKEQLWDEYARTYHPNTDLTFVLKNFIWIGKKTEK